MVIGFKAIGIRTGSRAALIALLSVSSAWAVADKLTDDEKIVLVRDLSSEYAKVKVLLPRDRKALPYNADGTWDKGKWQQAGLSYGVAARFGDQVQITKVTLDGDKIIFEINHGLKSGDHWYNHVQAGVGMSGPVIQQGNGMPGARGGPSLGTMIELDFHKPMEALTPDDVKKILEPIFDFDKRTATKLYSETLAPEVQLAIKEKRARVGMDREQVLLALGPPDHKYRETSKDGVDTEDWIYGKPPGKISFVTFAGSKVTKVKDEYAGLGGDTVAVQPTP